MKIINFAIFILGAILSICGFFLANADDYPFVLNLTCPSYLNGIKGIKTLEARNDLKPGIVGFKEIAIPLSNRLENASTIEKVPPCEIAIIMGSTSIAQVFSTSGIRSEREIKAKCVSGVVIRTTMETLIENVEKLKKRSSKWLSLFLFSVGLLLSLSGFLVERKTPA